MCTHYIPTALAFVLLVFFLLSAPMPLSLVFVFAFSFNRNVLPQDFANEYAIIHLSSLSLVQRGLPSTTNLNELLFQEVSITSPHFITVICLSLSEIIIFKFLLTY
jgi:hypothetical protein